MFGGSAFGSLPFTTLPVVVEEVSALGGGRNRWTKFKPYSPELQLPVELEFDDAAIMSEDDEEIFAIVQAFLMIERQ